MVEYELHIDGQGVESYADYNEAKKRFDELSHLDVRFYKIYLIKDYTLMDNHFHFRDEDNY